MSQTSSPQNARFEIGRAFADASRRLIRYWPALVGIEALGWAAAFGLDRFYRSLFPSMAALRAARSQPVGSKAWEIVVTVGSAGVIVAGLTRLASTRVALAESPSLARAVTESVGTVLRAAPALVVVVAISDLPTLIDVAVPLTRDVLASIPRTFAVIGVNLAVYMLIGPAIPVLAAEGRGPLQTIWRALRLVSRHRWSYFAIAMMPLPLTVLSGLLVTFAVGFAHQPRIPLAVSVIQILLSRLVALFSVVLAAATYRELTRIKEGWQPPDLADVFD